MKLWNLLIILAVLCYASFVKIHLVLAEDVRDILQYNQKGVILRTKEYSGYPLNIVDNRAGK